MEDKPKCKCGCTSNPNGYCDGSHLNKQKMDTLIIIISILMFGTAIMVALTAYGIFSDKDKDGIPDALEDRFKQLKEDIKEEIGKIKK